MKHIELKRYEGEVTQISGGRDDRAAKGTRRDYILIGESRVRQLFMSDYLDSILQSAKGRLELSVMEVTESESREPERFLAAIKLPSGEIAKDSETLLNQRQGTFVQALSVAPGAGALCFLLWIGTFVVTGFDVMFATLVSVAVFVALLFWPFVRPMRLWAVRYEEAMKVFDPDPPPIC